MVNSYLMIIFCIWFWLLQNKPVAFSVRTNVAYDGSLEEDSPHSGSVVSFGVRDFFHIKEVRFVAIVGLGIIYLIAFCLFSSKEI